MLGCIMKSMSDELINVSSANCFNPELLGLLSAALCVESRLERETSETKAICKSTINRDSVLSHRNRSECISNVRLIPFQA
jgi:hypothetical protein